MRVLLIIDALGFGGAEMLIADFVEGATSIGLDVEVAYLKERDQNAAAARLRSMGVDPIPVPMAGLLSPSSLRAVRRVVRRTKPDVVHTHLDYADFLGGLAASCERIPWVSTLHEMRWDDSTLRTRVKLVLFSRVRRHLARAVITVSAAGRAAYLARGWDRPGHVVTVRNGVVERSGTRPADELRAELDLRSDEIVVAMISVLRPGKGHWVAFEVMARLAPNHPELRLVVVGDGPEAEAYRAAASSLGERVVFTGHRDDVPDVLAAADVVLHPSEFDAYPTTLLEAMAARRAVLASAVGGIPEIVEDGVTGILAPVGDVDAFTRALRALATDATLRRRLGDAGRATFESSLDAASWAARVRDVYADAISTRRRWSRDP